MNLVVHQSRNNIYVLRRSLHFHYRDCKNGMRRHASSSLPLSASLLPVNTSTDKQHQINFAQMKQPLLDQVLVFSKGEEVSDDCNIPINIANRIGSNLHLQPNHPLNTIKHKIETYWQSRAGDESEELFEIFDSFSPIVSTVDNFDSLLIPLNHISRSKSDTYYLDQETVLRTHTSAHQLALLNNFTKFLVSGDVYRRDEIDSSHYPIFHQMEGVHMFGANKASIKEVEQDLKQGLEGMATMLFGDREMRWVDAYFPFTEPSYELEVLYEGEWLEVLGCGVIQRKIVQAAGKDSDASFGWAFGLGLERLAMVLFGVPDIRLFWTDDPRFHDQFTSGEIISFQPYSKYPPCLKDISFWTPENFHANDFNECVRNIAGDLVEKVELIDEFLHPKTNKTSNCYRITYRSMDRSLTNEEIDALQEEVRVHAREILEVELR